MGFQSTRLAGSRDRPQQRDLLGYRNFNPRGSQGAATIFVALELLTLIFQSTRLAGSRDCARSRAGRGRRDFNPRGSQGAATYSGKGPKPKPIFQSTRLAGSRDVGAAEVGHVRDDFNPRGSQGAATLHSLRLLLLSMISIHAARREPRRRTRRRNSRAHSFQSTRLAGSRDYDNVFCFASIEISIHAARREPRPSRPIWATGTRRYFNPRGSQGAATSTSLYTRRQLNISIHAARREPRPYSGKGPKPKPIFQSTRLAGSRDVHNDG